MPLVTISSYQSPSRLFNAHLQTIFPAIFRKVTGVQYSRERITTKDGDFLDLDWYKNNSSKLIILSHGLEGDSHRPYIKGMVKAFARNNWDAVAWNFRGCSGEVNKLARFYHSGATDDLRDVVEKCLSLNQYQEIVLIGFSLGGNLTLKYLGEEGKNLPPAIKKGIVFSVPLDLHASCLKISEPSQYIYSRRFLTRLKSKVKAKDAAMPGVLNLAHFKSIKKIKEFDEFYTAPLHGFESALHYYQSCSSLNFLDKIEVPTLIVNAQNDPFLSIECFPFELVKQLESVYLETPEEGGHCGFASFNKQNLYWSESRALAFAEEKPNTSDSVNKMSASSSLKE